MTYSSKRFAELAYNAITYEEHISIAIAILWQRTDASLTRGIGGFISRERGKVLKMAKVIFLVTIARINCCSDYVVCKFVTSQ